jgi:ATP sulfurylase
MIIPVTKLFHTPAEERFLSVVRNSSCATLFLFGQEHMPDVTDLMK